MTAGARAISGSGPVDSSSLRKGDAVPIIVGCSDGGGDEDVAATDGVDKVAAVLFCEGVCVDTIERVVRISCHGSGGRGGSLINPDGSLINSDWNLKN